MIEIIKIIILFTCYISTYCRESDVTTHENWKYLNDKTCGTSESDRIIGGDKVPIGKYPWLARIGYLYAYPPYASFRCGGSLATDEVVVTAAHCVYGLGSECCGLFVRLGENDAVTDPDCNSDYCADPVIDVDVSQTIMHKYFNPRIFVNDVAILRLKEKVRFTSFVKPICFPHGDLMKKDLAGSVCEVAGWGVTNWRKNKESRHLYDVKIAVMDDEKCRKFLAPVMVVDSYQICAGGVIGKDSCRGDSGGPLMKIEAYDGAPRYYIIGLVSFGVKQCGITPIPGIYTRITSFTNWILDNLKENKGHYTIIDFS